MSCLKLTDMIRYGGMKKDIHPKYFPKTKVTCSCGNSFEVGSTVPEIHVEVCSACHPFYTGTQKFIDTAGRVDKFRAKIEKAKSFKAKNLKKSSDKKATPEIEKTK